MDPPSGRVPEQGPDWFLVATQACGGGTPDLGFFLGVSVFIGIFGVGLTSGGSPSHPRDRGHAQGVGHALRPREWLGTLLAQIFYSGGFFWSTKNHQKFYFYHLPTRGRAWIMLGDAWYVSNISIIFYCSMLLYYPSRMFYMHLYAILYDFWD